MQKTLFIAAIVFVIAVGAYMYLTKGPATEPTTSTATSTPITEEVYTSNTGGLSFKYPSNYKVEARSDAYEGEPISVMTLIDEKIVVPEQSDGPTAISIIVLPNTKKLPLDAWVKTKSISNFNLSPDKKLSSTTVAGESAISYTHTGLYESDAVAVTHGDKIYLFSVGWADSTAVIRTDFQKLLQSVTFSNYAN